MIAKTFFLAKTFYRYSARIFRDHGIPAAGYPGGVSAARCEERFEALPAPPRPIRARRPATVINHPPRRPRSFNSPSGHPAERADGLGWPVFSEAITTGPAAVLVSLADPALPAGCRTITSQTAYPGGIRALAAARLGLGSWAFEVTGTGKFPVWTWAEVVWGPGFLLEVRIPVQSGLPGSDAGAWLGSITAAACQRAVTTLA